jgi:hypothetical protein
MKTTKFTCLALLILTLPAARGEPFRTDINPALLYYQAFILAPNLPETDLDYLLTTNWQGQKLPERFGTLVSNYNAELKLLRQSALQKVSCDWGIDMSRGPETLLPHLASAKQAAQGVRLHAMWELQNGNEAEARDDLLAGLALGRNVSKNSTLISVLVELAIESIVNTTVAENFHRFSPKMLQQLADGFAAAPARGTVAACAPTEKLLHNWKVARIEELRKQYPGNNAAAMEALHQLVRSPNLDSRDKDWEQLTNAAGGTLDGVIKLIRDSEPLSMKLGEIMALPHGEYEDQMQQFTAEVQKSGNPLFSQQLPGWQASRRKEFISMVDSAMVHAAIEYKLHGEAGLKSVMDPCGNSPFTFQRFVFEGVDQGFELKSVYNRGRGPETYIFVEKNGPPFYVMGDHAGKPVSP